MSLILHMKIPGVIVIASDCRITGTEQLYINAQSKQETNGTTTLNIGKIEELKLVKKAEGAAAQIPFGHYDYVKTDNEQKTFLLKNSHNSCFAVSYCGNANLNGYPASYCIRKALKNMLEVETTKDIAEQFKELLEKINLSSMPSFLISGYNNGKASVLELKPGGSIFEHFNDENSFGVAYHGEQAVTKALIDLGDYRFTLFRLQDAIEFCATMITTTAKIQSFQNRQQTVSEAYDLLVITEQNAEWIKRSTFELA